MGSRSKHIHAIEKTFLKKSEAHLLDHVIQTRKDILDTYIDAQGLPTSSKDIRVLNELMTSIEEGISKRVTARQRAKEVENHTVDRTLVLELLKNISFNTNMEKDKATLDQVKSRDLTLPSDYEDEDIDQGVFTEDPVLRIKQKSNGELDINSLLDDDSDHDLSDPNWLKDQDDDFEDDDEEYEEDDEEEDEDES